MSVCVSANPVFATNKELNLTVLVCSLSVDANNYLSATNQEHLFFDLELFESDLPLQFLSFFT